MPDNLVIADTSCLILLSKVNELEILKANYSRIIVTPEIATEFNEAIPDWIEVLSVENKSLQLLLQDSLDLGESIALACEIENPTIIPDDRKARKLAAKG